MIAGTKIKQQKGENDVNRRFFRSQCGLRLA